MLSLITIEVKCKLKLKFRFRFQDPTIILYGLDITHHPTTMLVQTIQVKIAGWVSTTGLARLSRFKINQTVGSNFNLES